MVLAANEPKGVKISLTEVLKLKLTSTSRNAKTIVRTIMASSTLEQHAITFISEENSCVPQLLKIGLTD